MIIRHRNYRSYDKVMIKLPYDEFFENMVIDAFLACLFNVRYFIFLSMVHEYAYFLWIYLEIGLLYGTRSRSEIHIE